MHIGESNVFDFGASHPIALLHIFLFFWGCLLPVKSKPLTATSPLSLFPSLSLSRSLNLTCFPSPDQTHYPHACQSEAASSLTIAAISYPLLPFPSHVFFLRPKCERTGRLIFPNNSVTKKMAGEARRMKSLVIGQVVDGF